MARRRDIEYPTRRMYKAFHQRFPEIGVTETRMIRHVEAGEVVAEHLFLELYCDEDGCDCRRLIVHVVSPAAPSALVATLAFGWENEQFYRDWARHQISPDELLDLKGPAMPSLSPQSERAPEMLAQFQRMLADRAYVERIKRHYAMFRASLGRTNRKARRKPRG